MTPLDAAAAVCLHISMRDDDVGNALLRIDYMQYLDGNPPDWLNSYVERRQFSPTSPPMYMIPARALATYALGGTLPPQPEED